jgi:predicted lipoprotein with Yx(FWY)xxD motif
MPLSRLGAAALSLTALVLIAAGCGGSSSSSSSSSQPSQPASGSAGSSGSATTVSASESPELGMVLVDSEGFTVYTFAKDNGTTSSCYGACAEAWPPVIASGKPVAGEGATSSELGTTKRKDGTVQVTYAGHPLYTFAEDRKPGEANGNGVTAFGAEWNALDESGSAVAASTTSGGSESGAAESGAAAPAESTESSGGYGY